MPERAPTLSIISNANAVLCYMKGIKKVVILCYKSGICLKQIILYSILHDYGESV